MRRLVTRSLLAAGFAAVTAATVLASSHPVAAASGVIGSGSSFAGIEFQEWSKDVAAPPYNLSVNYQSSSSGQGRSNFSDNVVDFAVSDIRYNKYDTNPPDPSTFTYVPVTAGGVSFMYNLKSHNFTASNPVKLSSLTVCGIFTGAIPYWDDQSIQADNPGVSLPHVAVKPVVRSDPAGTNYVMEEYCIATHNDLYSAFVASASKSTGTDYPDEPTSNWPIVTPIVAAQGSDNAADTVSDPNDDGYITAVETGYALQRGFPTASVKNDTGAYVQPSDAAVATALSYASQQADGTHSLNFAPGDPAAYNPSTYSYLLLHVGPKADPAKGAALTQFAEYDLTIGQAGADRLGYASIGRSLILFGLDRLKAVPGYVSPTQNELNAVPAQQQVQQHGTTLAVTGGSSTSGGTPSSSGGASVTQPSGGGSAPASGSTAQTAGAGGGSAIVPPGSTVSRSTGASRSSGGAVLASTDPSVSLGSQTGPLGQTGVESDLLLVLGGVLLVAGEAVRRRLVNRAAVS